jgi:hypothetical protein
MIQDGLIWRTVAWPSDQFAELLPHNPVPLPEHYSNSGPRVMSKGVFTPNFQHSKLRIFGLQCVGYCVEEGTNSGQRAAIQRSSKESDGMQSGEEWSTMGGRSAERLPDSKSPERMTEERESRITGRDGELRLRTRGAR